MPRGSLNGRDLLDVDDLDDDEVHALLARARSHAQAPGNARSLLAGRIVATLFFEPSTRTRLSFEAAAHRLGANVIGFSDAGGTSAKKGESLEDTVRTVAGYADLLVVRHPDPASARRAADATDIPVINAGDGSHAHPTQALLDLYTIQNELGRADDHHVVLLGDLKHGRTVHSLAVLLARCGNRLTFVAPPGLEMPSDVSARCRDHGPPPLETHDAKTALASADVLYATRLQKERFPDPTDAGRYAASYRVDEALLAGARDDLLILHPLPRVDEIDAAVDARPGAAYFRQAANGVPVRMAVLAALLGADAPETPRRETP